MAVPVYALDLYPRDDPRDGTLIRTLTPQKAGWRDEANSTGSGFVEVRSTSDDGQAFNPLGLDYVRVRDTANGDRIVGGFFNDKARIKLLTKDSTKLLRVEGAGTLSYLARAAMAPHTYLDIAIGTDPLQGVWYLSLNGPAAGGGMLGAMLWRAVYEAQHFRVALTQHRHEDGLIYTDSHDNDRTASDVGIPDLVLGFDQFEDSDGNPWTLPAGEFKANVGDSLLSVVKRLMEAGLYVEMDPDTFELRAWEGTDHRRDLTSASWAADKVRLQAPTDGTIATGNILSDADREVAAHVKRRTLYVGQAGSYVKVTGPTDIPWEGGVVSDAEDPDALEQVGETQLQARSDAGDTLKVRLKPGDDPTQGTYRAWEHVKPDDLITVHSGADQWEYDEQDFPVAAISINLREGGDWDTWLELGSSFAAADRRFSVAPVPAHNHGPNPELCRVSTLGIPPEFLAGGGAIGDLGGANTMALTVSGSDLNRAIYCFVRNTSGGTITAQWQPNGAVPGSRVEMDLIDSLAVGSDKVWVFRLLNPSATIASSVVRVADSAAQERWVAFFYLSGVDQTDPEDAAVFATGIGSVSSINVPQPSGTLALNGAGWLTNNQSGIVDPTPGGGQTSVFADSDDRPAGQPDSEAGAGYGSADPSWTFGGSRDWQAVGIAVHGISLGTEGDCPHDVGHECDVGTSTRAARCDHVHAHGNLSPSETHHHGTAQIEGYTAPVTDHGALTGLADDDHPQYTTAAEVTAAIEALRWEAVTNGENIFVWEDDDLVHEWKAY